MSTIFFSCLKPARILSRIQIGGCTGRQDWKDRYHMQIPHMITTKEFLNKEMEGLSVLQQQNSNKEISIGQYWQKCQCVNQTCNMV